MSLLVPLGSGIYLGRLMPSVENVIAYLSLLGVEGQLHDGKERNRLPAQPTTGEIGSPILGTYAYIAAVVLAALWFFAGREHELPVWTDVPVALLAIA